MSTVGPLVQCRSHKHTQGLQLNCWAQPKSVSTVSYIYIYICAYTYGLKLSYGDTRIAMTTQSSRRDEGTIHLPHSKSNKSRLYACMSVYRIGEALGFMPCCWDLWNAIFMLESTWNMYVLKRFKLVCNAQSVQSSENMHENIKKMESSICDLLHYWR